MFPSAKKSTVGPLTVVTVARCSQIDAKRRVVSPGLSPAAWYSVLGSRRAYAPGNSAKPSAIPGSVLLDRSQTPSDFSKSRCAAHEAPPSVASTRRTVRAACDISTVSALCRPLSPMGSTASSPRLTVSALSETMESRWFAGSITTSETGSL